MSLGGRIMSFDSGSLTSKELIAAYAQPAGCETLDEVLQGCTEETRAAAEVFFCQVT